MPKIPVYTPNQRIDASTPVAAVNTTDARMMGEATAGLGAVMARLGDTLDNTSKRAAAQEDAYTIKIAASEYQLGLNLARAQQKTMAIDPEDEASGVTGVERFKQNTQKMRDDIVAKLPARLRTGFLAVASEDFTSTATGVLADEVDKREKSVMVLRQENINNQAEIARKDPTQAGLVLARIERDIQEDALIPAAQKPAEILKAKQQAAKAAMQGLQLSGKWEQAEKALTEQFSGLFSADEMEKQRDTLINNRTGYFNDAWNKESRSYTRKNQKQKEDLDNATAMLLAKLESGGTQQPFDEVDMQLDFMNIPSGLKNDIKERRLVNKYKDTPTQGQLSQKFFADPDGAIEGARSSMGSSLSLSGGTKALQSFKVLKKAQDQDPAFKKSMDAQKKLIESFQEPRKRNINTGVMEEADATETNEVLFSFMTKAAELVQSGKGTPSAVEDLAYETIRANYSGKIVPTAVPGVSMETLQSSKSIQEKLQEFAARYKNKEFNTPEKEVEAKQAIAGLTENMHKARMREELAKRSPKKAD